MINLSSLKMALNSCGTGTVLLDGAPMQHLVKGVTITAYAGFPTSVYLDIQVDGVEFDGPVQVLIDSGHDVRPEWPGEVR